MEAWRLSWSSPVEGWCSRWRERDPFWSGRMARAWWETARADVARKCKPGWVLQDFLIRYAKEFMSRGGGTMEKHWKHGVTRCPFKEDHFHCIRKGSRVSRAREDKGRLHSFWVERWRPAKGSEVAAETGRWDLERSSAEIKNCLQRWLSFRRQHRERLSNLAPQDFLCKKSAPGSPGLLCLFLVLPSWSAVPMSLLGWAGCHWIWVLSSGWPWLQLAPCAISNCVTCNSSVFSACFLIVKWNRHIRSHKHRCPLGPGPWPKGTKGDERDSLLGRQESLSQTASICALWCGNLLVRVEVRHKVFIFCKRNEKSDFHVLISSVDN